MKTASCSLPPYALLQIRRRRFDELCLRSIAPPASCFFVTAALGSRLLCTCLLLAYIIVPCWNFFHLSQSLLPVPELFCLLCLFFVGSLNCYAENELRLDAVLVLYILSPAAGSVSSAYHGHDEPYLCYLAHDGVCPVLIIGPDAPRSFILLGR